ncbi:MAG: DHH family phosphoesterase [Lachnospiraceae bacterium]|nr:DHH family phosphoesterase [Lachnospiraceae bacterium]MBR4768448.1 DHH family phosphoesterase [Lachnospiraceae bacterium]
MEAKSKSEMKLFFRWPFFAGIVFVPAVLIAFLNLEQIWGFVALGFVLVYYLTLVLVYLILRNRIERRLVRYGESFAAAEGRLVREIDIPAAFTDGEGMIYWQNNAFRKTFSTEGRLESSLFKLFPNIETFNPETEEIYHVQFNDRQYRLEADRVPDNMVAEFEALTDRKDVSLYLIYLEDETDLLYYKQTLSEEKAVMALVYFDNYEEVMSDIEDVRRSLLSAMLERVLNKSFAGVRAVIRKLEKDRFFVVMKQESLWRLEEQKFPLLEEVKNLNIGNDMPITISIGIGLGGESFERNYEYARAAIDMALGRGGDQAVIKSPTEVRYFGGKMKSTERNTRVKARTKAHALRELIEAYDRVMIMGHPISDLDCIGAAVGIYRAARFSGKKAHIVLGDVSTSVKPLLATFTGNADYEEDLFIKPEEARQVTGKDTLLVVVDTNRPSYTVCPELLTMAPSVVVIDHHRQGRETIENAELSYVEPFASSASEMAAEVVQYYDDAIKLKPVEADAVFAGIVMDTNNFEDKAGVRTFEAAAYLRRCGADVTRVRKLFRDSMQDYKLRAETVSRAETFGDGYIISICPSIEGNPNQTVVAAQAANELLEIRGIKASFVLTDYEGKIFLSARSIDEVNVQVMMEKLGGGGHLSVAGAQFTGITMEEAVERLKAVIEEES